MKHELTDIFLKSAFQILVTEFVMNSYIQLLCFDKKALFYSYKFFLTNDFEIHFPVANYYKFKKVYAFEKLYNNRGKLLLLLLKVGESLSKTIIEFTE